MNDLDKSIEDVLLSYGHWFGDKVRGQLSDTPHMDLKKAKAQIKNLVLEARKEEWQAIIDQKRRPTHGNCCTCQYCGQGHDDCICEVLFIAERRIEELTKEQGAQDEA